MLPKQYAPSKSIFCTQPPQYATQENILYPAKYIMLWLVILFHQSSEGAHYALLEIILLCYLEGYFDAIEMVSVDLKSSDAYLVPLPAL